MLHVITDPGDERLSDYRDLRDSRLRKTIEVEGGLFIAEGATVIKRALRAGFEPRSFMLAPRWLPGLAEELRARPEAPVYQVSEEVAEAVSGFHVHRGALASMARRSPDALADVLAARRLVVCQDIVDPANMGAIMRCAAGLGWDGVVLTRESVDPLYRRAIKTSMGAVFDIPWARFEGLEQLRRAGLALVASSPGPGAVDLREFAAGVEREDRIALLVGTEGEGLTRDWLEAADVRVRIPMANGVDSLNVAAATAVFCHALG